jgi:sialate O-acetylesterase
MNKLIPVMKRLNILAMLLIICSCTGNVKEEKFSVSEMFSDNMVLQAGSPVNIWGKGSPGTKVEILYRDQHKKGRTGRDGSWKIVLDPEQYGGPDSLVVSTNSERITFHNVMAGEVWICSGQSNMEMPLISNWAKLNNAEEEVAAAEYSGIRLFIVQRGMSFHPLDTLVTDGWKICSPETVKDFSATAYFFGRELHRELEIPVGLIHTSWGGTVAEAWTSRNSLVDYEDFAETVELISHQPASMDSVRANFNRDLRKRALEIAELDVGIEGEDTVYSSGQVNTSDWVTMDLPGMVEETDLGVYDGSTWFIREVELSESMAGSELTLCYGAPDDSDEAWVNGTRVGGSLAWDVFRQYKIPAGIAKKGKNVIVIRLMDNQGNGGFMSEAKDFYIKSSSGRTIPIAKGWKAKKGFDFSDVKTILVSPFNPNQPTVLFNAMINPVIPYTMKGAIWYQGESNAGRAYQYRRLFRTLITDWRKEWGQGDFPFLFVQLANYLKQNEVPVEDAWAELREAQAMALELPNTGMAVAIDIGDARDIHPGNKQEVGRRLALNALARVYGQDVPYSGPMYKSMKIEGDAVELTFDYVLDGLQTSDQGPLKGFSIAGADGKFVWVVVRSPEITEPVAVRYAWASNPECNLVNSAGLPASPFRTDIFKGVTQPD